MGHRWPELLPGGLGVVFTVQTGSGPNDFRTAAESLATHERTTLVEGATFARYSPTGHLVYVLAGALHAAPFDAERLRLRGPAVRVLDRVATTPYGGAWLAFSRDGTLAFVPEAPLKDRQLVWVDRQGTVRPLPIAPQKFLGLSMAPNGKRVAVEIGQAAKANIWIYDLDDGTRSRLTDGEKSEVNPVWSRDGTRIVYSTGVPAQLELAWRKADGSEPAEPLLPGHWAFPKEFTADGRLLFFEMRGREPQGDVAMLRLDGTRRPEYVIASPAHEFAPGISPDGRFIGFLSAASGRGELYVAPYPGPGAPVQVTTEGAAEFGWSPRSEEIFVRNGSKLIAFPLMRGSAFSTGPPRLLFNNGRLWGINVSADGQRFLMVQISEEELKGPVIEVVQGWFEELRRHVP